MQKTTSQKALKVISIIMIVFAALTLLLGIGGIVTGGALGILGAGSGDAGSAASGHGGKRAQDDSGAETDLNAHGMRSHHSHQGRWSQRHRPC